MADQKTSVFDVSLFEFQPTQEWEIAFEGDGFKIWRRLRSGSALYEYRTIGVIKEVPPKQYFQFYLDSENWKTWDPNMENVEIFLKEADNVEWLYWAVKFPFPFSNRDYVYKRHSYDLGDELYLIKCVSTQHESKVANSRRVRVVDYDCTVAMRPAKDGQSTQLFLDYFEDLQMSIPTSLMNWVTKTAVPDFIKRVSERAKAYKQ